jgi:hypothetical protein
MDSWCFLWLKCISFGLRPVRKPQGPCWARPTVGLRSQWCKPWNKFFDNWRILLPTLFKGCVKHYVCSYDCQMLHTT